MSTLLNDPKPCTYHSIPDRPTFENEQGVAASRSSWHSYLPTSPSSRRFLLFSLRAVACIAICSLVAFAGFTSVGHARSGLSSKGLAASLTMHPRHFAGHNRQSSADHWEKVFAVPTRNCDAGLNCRAVVVAEMKDGVVTFSAGYRVFADVAKKVPSSTQQRIAAVTRADAEKWAQQLLNLIENDLTDLDFHISAEKIATSILAGAQVAKTCPHTTDPLCSPSETVSTVQLSQPSTSPSASPSPTKDPCLTFRRYGALSDANFEEMKALKAMCGGSVFYNRYEGNEALCVATCPNGSQRTVLSNFVVQWSTGYSHFDCLASVYHPMYEYFRGGNLPSCETQSFRDIGLPTKFLILYSREERIGSVPDKLVDEAQTCADAYFTYVFFSTETSLSEMIDKACT